MNDTTEALLERLANQLLSQQRSERRWRIFFRLAWLALALAVAWALLSDRFGQPAPSTPHTALIEVRGEIAEDTEASAEALVSALRSAFEDEGAQAVVLRINSPGGSPVQSGIVNDEIRRLKALHGKRVYAVVEEVCASGAYYIAVAADEIYVDKASIVGSIGVLMDGFGFTGLTDLGLLSQSLPGYLSLPREAEQDLEAYYKPRALKPLRPNQMSAALLRSGPDTCRSRQFTLALSWPPTNHFG